MTAPDEQHAASGVVAGGTPAGWLPDPDGSGDRWWNGLSWGQLRQAPPQPENDGAAPEPRSEPGEEVPVLIGLDPEVIRPGGDPWHAALICDLPDVDPASTVSIPLTPPVVSALYASLGALRREQRDALGLTTESEADGTEADGDQDDSASGRPWSSVGDPIGAVTALRWFSPAVLAGVLILATIIALVIR